MARKGLVVDLDGTVWDSWPFYADLVSSAGHASSLDLLGRLRSGGNLVRLIEEAPGMSRTAFESLCEREGARLRLYPGVRDALQAASETCALGVATSLPAWVAEPLLRVTGLGPLFGAVIHAGNCRRRKPDPTRLHMAFDRMGVSPECSVFVGDTALDAAMALRAGVEFLWVDYGYERPERGANTITEFREVLSVCS